MGQPIPAQHPSVVLKSHFNLVRALLALAMAAVIALTAAVVILANDDDQVTTASNATPAVQPQTAPGVRYDGGPEEGTADLTRSAPTPKVSPAPSSIAAGAEAAYQRMRSQGSANPQTSADPQGNTRYDGGPEEGSRGSVQLQFKERAGGPVMLPQGPAGH